MATPNLSYYLSQTRLLLHDTLGSLYPTADLTSYINSARSQLALESECVRYLSQFNTSSSGLVTGTYTAGNPVLAGIGSRTIGEGVVNADQIYDFAPGTVVIASTLTNTTISPAPLRTQGSSQIVTFYPALATVAGQEAYFYNGNVQSGTPILTSFGLQSIIQVKSITVNWGGTFGSNAYMLDYWDFRSYQAYLRFYGPTGLQGNPAVWTAYQNTVFMRPVPTQAYPMQWDTICSVIDLASDADVEAIPYPFTDAIPYYAAYLALLNSQRSADAGAMKERYEEYIKRARAFVQRTIVPTMYPGGGYR